MISIGDIVEKKGKIIKGSIDLLTHPTGSNETIAVIIASGKNDGPTFLLTANIHGDELVGVIICHRILESLDLDTLKGRIIIIPSLNPTGNRRGHRYPQFDQEDPNRKWPDSNPNTKDNENKSDWLDKYYVKKPTTQEVIWARLYEEFKNIKPDYHIDLHTFSNMSIPFIFLDRVFYEKNKEEAVKLFDRVKEMVNSIGLTVIVENPAKKYIEKKLHRSTSGATLNGLRIPSCTIELGPMDSADQLFKQVGIKAVNNFMRWAGMIEGEKEVIFELPVIMSRSFFRYIPYPRATATGILDITKYPGDFFSKGDTLAVIRDLSGNRVDNVIAELDGFVIGWWNGIAKYKDEEIGMVAVEDKMPMIIKWADIKEN